MSKNFIPDGGTAFPMQDSQAIHAYAAASVEGISDPEERDRLYTVARAQAVGGMSLREYYAGEAIRPMLSMYGNVEALGSAIVADKLAKAAFNVAEAMVREAQRRRDIL